jgi:hypothetical protein
VRKIFIPLVGSALMLHAQVIPGINSKAGAMVVPEGKVVMGIKNISFKRDSMFDGSDEVTNKEKLDAKANVTLLGLRYGVATNADITIMVPYKQIEATAQLGSNGVAIDNSGIGDIVVMGKYVFINMQKYGYQVAVDGGIKLPTGSTDSGFKKAPPFAKDTNTPLPTQMGTGAVEYKIGLGFSKMIDSTWRSDAHTMFTYRPKAEHDYDFGNELAIDLSTTKAITDKINIGIEYNFKYNSKTDMGDDTNPILRSKLPFKAFSGSAGYITPQIEYLPFGKPKIHVGVGVSILAHYNLKEYQPLEKTRVVARVGYLF